MKPLIKCSIGFSVRRQIVACRKDSTERLARYLVKQTSFCVGETIEEARGPQ